jgi:TonB family protein
VPLERAVRSLGITDLVETKRAYAVDELEPGIRAQVESLPDSAWSAARSWRGRYAFFQVLGREERARSALPKLGEGLGDEERKRLAAALQSAARQVEAGARPAEPGLEPATVLEQVPAEYPPAATGNGEVTLSVDVGRLGQVLGVRVESSTDPIFEGPAIEAARTSRYKAARRPPGIAEPGTVRLTYKFTAPQNP